MANKSPSELNTKQIRVGLGDYALIDDFSQSSGVTMAEALHSLLEKQGHVGYTVTIRTRAGTTIMSDIPPAALPELLKFVQNIELAEIRTQRREMPTSMATDANLPEPAPQGPAAAPQEAPAPEEPMPALEEPAAAQEEEVPEEKLADPRRSRFVTLF